jgi:hypothetical protein
MLDTGASGISIARKPQVTALQKLNLLIQINNFIAGFYKIKFRVGEAVLLGTIQVRT